MTAVIDADRMATVQAAVDTWVKQMVDLSGGNRLLFYRELKRGTLNITPGNGVYSEPIIIALCTGGEVKSVELLEPIGTDYLTPGDRERAELRYNERQKDIARRLTAVRSKGTENLEERGINTQYLADGALTWDNEDGQAIPNAPILLTPIELEQRTAGAQNFVLRPLDQPEINPTLLLYLSERQGIQLNAEDILESATNEAGVLDRFAVFERILHECEAMPNVDLVASVVIGNFSYSKLPMVQDLKENVELLASNNLVAAIAGVSEAVSSLRSEFPSEIDPAMPDSTDPREDFLVLDADSSQHVAINRCLRGESLVIQGPPGTGKSQTIANLIAALTANGKHVLFVAEKGAAIEAVRKNLVRVGLGDVMMDLHGKAVTKSQVAKMLQVALGSLATVKAPDVTATIQDLERTRERLGAYRDALHSQSDSFGLSYFDARTALEPATAPVIPVEIPRKALQHLNLASITEAARSVTELVELGRGRMLRDSHPWASSSIRTEDAANKAVRKLDELRTALSTLAAEQSAFYAQLDADEEEQFYEVRNAIAVSADFNQAASWLEPEALTLDLGELRNNLEPAERNGPSRFFASMFNGSYRSAKRTLREITRSDTPVPELEARARLNELSTAGAAFQERFDSTPREVEKTALEESLGNIETAIEGLRHQAALSLDGTSGLAVQSNVESLEQTADDAFKLPRINQLEDHLAELDLLGVAQKLLLHDAPAVQLAESLKRACFDAIAARLRNTSPELSGFVAATHERTVDEFRQADTEHLRLTAGRVQRAIGEHARTERNTHPDQSQFVSKEANKKTRHASVRKMIDTAPDVIGALKPCWAMSPLAVSSMLPARSDFFDVVIFDEASQVLPADAVPAIMRAAQVVVAGDTRQLPPTNFFASGDADGDGDDEEEEDLSLTEGFESILDVMNVALPKAAWLQWHYRSRDERLINFSNAHIYDKSLRTFPGIAGEGCVRKVDAAAEKDSTIAELLEIVFDHARDRPDRSLGVITTSATTARNFENMLYEQLREMPPVERAGLEPFFDDSKDERFFVKNIERVQGDERDDIVLAVDLARSPEGRVWNRLGPLNQKGGERRLNVAVTRARRSITLCTNFRFDELAPSSFKNEGARLIREYTRYAECGGNDLGAEAEERPALNAFEIDVQNRLVSAGMRLTPQFGVAGYFIDFVAAHPNDPNRPVLAIEADGATYHSSPTARDRDRLRQSVLEGLGWTFHRIWSTEWFSNPEGEVERVLRSWKEATTSTDLGLNSPSQRQARDVAPAFEATAGDVAEPAPPTRRGRRPISVVEGYSIMDYKISELVQLIQWLESDGVLHVDEELIELAAKELGFARKGARIKKRLGEAIKAHRG